MLRNLGFTIWEEELPDLSIYSALNGLYWEEGLQNPVFSI